MLENAVRAEIPAEGEAQAASSLRTWIALAVAALVLLAGLIAPPPPGLTAPATHVLGVLGAAIVLWASGGLHPTLVALGMMVLWPLVGVMPYSQAAAGFGSNAIWLMIGIFMLSAAFIHSGLDRRVVYRLLYLGRGRTRATMLWVVLALLVLTALVPTAAGRAGIMLGIGRGMMRAMNLPRGSNVGKALFMLVSYVTLFSSNALMTGAIVMLFSASIFQELAGHTWNFASWMVVGTPPVLVAAVAVWALMLRLHPPELEALEGGRVYLRERLDALGPMSAIERKVAVLIGGMLLGWMTAPWHGLETHMVCLIATMLVFLPPFPVMPVEEALNRVPWHIVLLFGASLSLTSALQRSQIPDWLAGAAGTLPSGTLPPPGVGLAFMLLVLVLRFGFPNAVALAATVLPITIVAAGPLHVNPVWLGMLALIPTQLPLLPMVSPGVMILYSGGYFKTSDMLLKTGPAVAAVVIGVSLLFALFYWPMVGLSP